MSTLRQQLNELVWPQSDLYFNDMGLWTRDDGFQAQILTDTKGEADQVGLKLTSGDKKVVGSKVILLL